MGINEDADGSQKKLSSSKCFFCLGQAFARIKGYVVSQR